MLMEDVYCPFSSRNPQVTGAGGKGTFSGALTPGLLGLRHGRGALRPHSPAPLRLRGLWLTEVETKLEQPHSSHRCSQANLHCGRFPWMSKAPLEGLKCRALKQNQSCH